MKKPLPLNLTGSFLSVAALCGLVACAVQTANLPAPTVAVPTRTQEYAKMIKQWMADPAVTFVLNNGQGFLFDTPNGNEFEVSSYSIREDDFVKEDGSQHHGMVAWLSIVILDRTISVELPPHKVYKKSVYIGQTLIVEGFTSNFSVEILDMQDALHDEDNRGYVVIRTAKVAKKK